MPITVRPGPSLPAAFHAPYLARYRTRAGRRGRWLFVAVVLAALAAFAAWWF